MESSKAKEHRLRSDIGIALNNLALHKLQEQYMGYYDSCYYFEQLKDKPSLELFRNMKTKDSGEYYILGPEKVHMDSSLWLPLRYNSEYGATQGAKELAAKFKCNYTVVKAVAIVEMPAEPTVRKL